MVLPVGPAEGHQTLRRIVRTETGSEPSSLLAVRFVPLLPGEAREL